MTDDVTKLRAELEAARAERQRLYEQNVQLRKDFDAAMGGREAMEATRDGVRQRDLARIAALEAEIADLRQAVIAMCDTYSANRSEKQKVKAYRHRANRVNVPFSLAAVETEIEVAEQAERQRELRDAVDRVQAALRGFATGHVNERATLDRIEAAVLGLRSDATYHALRADERRDLRRAREYIASGDNKFADRYALDSTQVEFVLELLERLGGEP